MNATPPPPGTRPGRDAPLVKALIDLLPDVGDSWPEHERKTWLDLFEMALGQMYIDDER
jgi:hypothetical protein